MTTNVQGRSQILRAAIVTVLATAALSQMPVRKAHAACTDTIAGVITCTGDLSGGVNASNPADNNDFNDKTTTVLRVENVTTPIAPPITVNGVRIEERRPFARDGDPEMQDVTVHITGTAGQPVTISTQGIPVIGTTAAVSLVTTTGEASDGADATSGFLCAGSDSAEVGHNGLDGNQLIANITNVNIIAANGGGVRLENAAGIGGYGGHGNACHGSEAGGVGGGGAVATLNLSNTSIMTSGAGASGITVSSAGGKGGHGGDGGAFRYGSRGGVGGDGGTVNITGSATIETSGNQALGIHAVSLGGDGGDGGDSSAFGGGGNGPLGAGGGTVTVDGTFDIHTHGVESHGIGAYSIGGRGGQGGDDTFFNPDAGEGGGTADSGDVFVTNRGTIETDSNESHGIVAQSVAGHAGSAGDSNSIVVFGAGGGSAGDGGEVNVDNRGAIATHGERAHAIFAQSIGGGGGSGGGGFSAFYSGGGSGGSGGNGSTVRVTNSATLTTDRIDSRGIYAQSIGGAGGDGGDSGGIVAIGGRGATTSDGGLVHVENTGDIHTRAHAIFAESIGGGGGNGGDSSGWFSVGGTGGAGGAGGKVEVSNSGDLTTVQNNSSAIFAHSIGGGGGNGGHAVAVGVVAAIAIGGDGAEGGDAETVTVDSLGGRIETGIDFATSLTQQGHGSHGIFAQSIGGGGGNGGFATSVAAGNIAVGIGGEGAGGGNGKAVDVESASTIITHGDDAHAVYAESVGGGGGSGGFAVTLAVGEGTTASLAIGGKGGGGGTGDIVDVVSTGANLHTSGDRSYGILAQSVGGGGGNGGFAIAGSLSIASPSGAFALGGTGAGGGGASDVTVDSSSNIFTEGVDSHGLFAQSLGGGGGSGGFAVSGSASSTVAVSASMGGSGAAGGNAGSVSVGVDELTTGTIHTRGDRANGLIAQSVGGGGGAGGFSVAGSISFGASASLSIGGDGGLARDGDTVTVRTASTITTEGSDAHGLFAQSIGGGGGKGGFAVSGALNVSGGITAALGGGGGGGGAANTVTVENRGAAISTSGEHSYGLLAQSVGGGGGDGGFAVAGSITQGGSANLGLGGDGAQAGISRDVFVTSTSQITTRGDDSHALFAQSVGGGGGSGGFSVAGSINVGGGSVGAALGGAGNGGGNSGRVFVTTTAEDTGVIMTEGDRSTGLFAQSVGGGGGNGGFAVAGSINNGPSANFSIGGNGGTGAHSDTVFVNSGTSIATRGSDSHGIFAQSLGGGGGSGGFAVAAGISTQGAVQAALGGKGNGGGNAQDVTLLSSGEAIETQGTHAYGIAAQSVGGGGGDGGFAVAGGIANGPTASFSLGGSGSGGGFGRNVLLDSGTSVVTHGDDSHGVFAQSLGGGGGSGGFAITGGISRNDVSASIGGSGAGGGAGGLVTLNNTAALVDTSGKHSYGVLAQSIGGGGGDGGFAIAGGISDAPSARFGLGGSGDGGGDSSAVRLTTSSNVVTRGDDSHAVFAQSLGGGGGSGGFAIAGGIGTDNAQVNAAVGGSGDGGGNASAVELFNSGEQIATLGARSYGLVAQSVGGGGGDGGFAISGSIGKGPAANFSLGGSGDGGGNGADVTLNSGGRIGTTGEESHAIFAQSVGGGGGSGGFSVAGSVSGDRGSFNASVGGSGGGGGNAGRVLLGNVAAIDGVLTTEGDRAYGVLAQSVGGGGGDGGFSVAAGISKGEGAKFSLGGAGDTGGNSDLVSVRSASTIVTHGADAHGLFAQSIGGGGGSGGFSVTGSIATQGASVGASIGGAGAGGGTGGDVEAISLGDLIMTSGARSYGIVAQSIGGGGGDGGFSVAGSISRTTNVNLSIGGSGDVGGDAGDVSVRSSTDILTEGEESHAISAQSIGGGGGSGGFSVAGSLFGAANSSPKIDVSFGGSGDGGGAGGAVDVGAEDDHISGIIETLGGGAHGIFAMSLGGGGGDGGFSVGAGVSQSPQMTIGIGGSAGTASDGGAVHVFTGADIYTHGAQSYGVSAQSLGGGGGNGGFAVAGSATTDLTSVGVSLGGKGGGGGKGGTVDVTNSGNILTMGEISYGVFAESIGGGGGDGGFSISGSLSKPPAATTNPRGPRNLDIAIGGNGGTGNVGGDVSVTNDGRIDTLGKESHGILAHSVGGGGGDGGLSAAGSLGLNTQSTQGTRAVISVSVGGFGGDGNVGGDVSVTNTRVITTEGEKARGIYAYSVGGGGGNGGMSFAIDTLIGKPHEGNGLNLEIAVGGVGGDGNDGGRVHVDNGGDIQTLGDRSDAIYAQSIGGGGGDGGEAHGVSLDFTFGGGPKNAPAKDPNDKSKEWNFVAAIGGNGGTANDGGAVSVTNSGNIVTTGVNARGIVAQSVGAGGGNGGSGISGTGLEELDKATELLDLKDKNIIDLRNWTVIVGGDAGASGDGGDILVHNTGSIGTTGLGSVAIFAQSIGGGGGEAQNYVKGAGEGGSADTGLQGKFSIGGGGGASGDGGDVTVNNVGGDLITEGDDAHAIFAQSVGGGGGVAGNVDRGFKDGIGPIPPLNVGIGLAFGRDGGSGGTGGAVSVTNTSNIFTHGVGSFGIFAQSIGGGGGLAGGLGNENIPILEQQNFAGSVGGDGDAGAITITQHGDVVVLGDAADGIFAQSDAANGNSGAVTIEVAGHIDAGGAHSNGIRAQSQGDMSSGAIAVTITSGSVRGGTDSGAAVTFIDGAANTLKNHGDIGRLDELDRVTVLGGTANESIENFGGVYGTLSLGGGTNSFTNRDGGTVASGATLDLGANAAQGCANAAGAGCAGAAGTARNEGVWSVGRSNEISHTALAGDFTQAASGALLLDIDHLARTTDRIDVVGSADLAGSIELNQINISKIRPGATATVLVAADGGLSADDIVLAVTPSIVTQYALQTISATELALTLSTSFVPQNTATEHLLPNEKRIGTYINDVQLAGSSASLASTITSLVAATDITTLGSKYQALNPENYAALPLAALQSGLQFGESLLSCKVRDGVERFTAEGECAWAAAFGSSGERDATDSSNGYRRDVNTISIGTQWSVSDAWHLGLAAAFDRDQIDSETLSNLRVQSAEGRTVHAGMVLKGNFGSSTVAASFSASRGSYDSHRSAMLALRGSQSEQVVYQTAWQFRVSHGFEYDSWYLRPLVDLGFTNVRLSAFSEHGASANNLLVRNAEGYFVNFRPALELGFETPLGGAMARWYARLGVNRFIDGHSFGVEAMLQGAPDDAGFMGVSQDLDRTVRECAAGVDVLTGNGVTLRLGYSGQFTASGTTHGATLKFTRSF
jgi:hypothetical protein